MDCNVSETVCAFIIGRDVLSDAVHVFAAHVQGSARNRTYEYGKLRPSSSNIKPVYTNL